MWTYIQYTILIERALLNVNIVNIQCICTLIFPLKLEYESKWLPYLQYSILIKMDCKYTLTFPLKLQYEP
jgi:hypothetical protein